MSDQDYMQHALALAQKGQYSTRPNPCVGCVIVRDQQVVGQGWHQVAGGPHAEIMALQQARDLAKQSTVYVTLEPCAHQGKTGPCVQALIDAQVARVIVAMQDPNPQVNGQGIARLRQAGILVDVGLCQQQAQQLNQGFCFAMQRQRPFVRLKQAMSIDGRIALANGHSKWITSIASRLDVQQLRARSAAIITGVATVIADNSRLTVRTSEWSAECQPSIDIPDPIRVVVDRQLRIPFDCQLVQTAQSIPTWIFCRQSANPDSIQRLQDVGVQVVKLPGCAELSSLLDYLYRHHCYDVMIESGASLASQALQQGLVNEWWLYIGHRVFGHDALPVVRLPQVDNLADTLQPTLIDVRQFEQDIRLRYQF